MILFTGIFPEASSHWVRQEVKHLWCLHCQRLDGQFPLFFCSGKGVTGQNISRIRNGTYQCDDYVVNTTNFQKLSKLLLQQRESSLYIFWGGLTDDGHVVSNEPLLSPCLLCHSTTVGRPAQQMAVLIVVLIIRYFTYCMHCHCLPHLLEPVTQSSQSPCGWKLRDWPSASQWWSRSVTVDLSWMYVWRTWPLTPLDDLI